MFSHINATLNICSLLPHTPLHIYSIDCVVLFLLIKHVMWCNTYFYYIQFCGDVCVCVVWCPVNQLCDAARKSRNVSLSLSLRSHKLGKNHFSAIKIQEVTGFLVYCHHMFAPTARRGTRFLIDAIEAKLSAKLQDGSIAFPDSLPHTQRYITILFGRCAVLCVRTKLN